MGIKGNFKPTIRKLFPDCFRIINGRELSGKTIAIDFSNMYFRYKSIFRDGNVWSESIFSYLKKLAANGIDFIIVFDGVAPDIKKNEQNKRRDRKNLEKNKIENIIKIRDEFIKTGIITEELCKMMEKKPKTPEPSVYKYIIEMPCDISDFTPAAQSSSDPLDFLENLINRLKSSQVPKFDYDEVAKFERDCNNEKIKIINASGEAEQTCAWLYKEGIVDCVLSQDSDLIPLRCSFVTNYKKSFGLDFEYFDYQVFKEKSRLGEDQITDWCILCGTDYNNSIPGVGAVKALKYITKHKTIENLMEHFTNENDIVNGSALAVIIKDLKDIRDQFNCANIDRVCIGQASSQFKKQI